MPAQELLFLTVADLSRFMKSWAAAAGTQAFGLQIMMSVIYKWSLYQLPKPVQCAAKNQGDML